MEAQGKWGWTIRAAKEMNSTIVSFLITLLKVGISKGLIPLLYVDYFRCYGGGKSNNRLQGFWIQMPGEQRSYLVRRGRVKEGEKHVGFLWLEVR